MSKFILIENDIVTQVQDYDQTDFVETSFDDVLNHMVHDGSGDYDEANFSTPVRLRSWDEVRAKQRKMITDHSDLIEIHEREVAHNGTDSTDYGMTPAIYQDWLTYFQDVRDCDDKNLDGNSDPVYATPEDAITAMDAIAQPVTPGYND